MARYIYSKVDPSKLLHIINRLEDITKERKDIIPADNFLNISSFILPKDKTFIPHKHLWHKDTIHGDMKIANESWCIINGSVLATLYDIDNVIVEEVILKQGDFSWSSGEGGHNYKSLEENTVVYEFKTAPYFGREIDKEALSG